MSVVTELLLPKNYGYVLLATSTTFLITIWHGTRVTSARKKAGIKYPQAYAEKSDFAEAKTSEQKDNLLRFNSAQRAHGNFLENLPIVAVSTLVAGFKYPRVAAGMSFGWNVARVLFAVGYSDVRAKNGSGRYRGSMFWVFQVILIGLVGYMGVDMLLQ